MREFTVQNLARAAWVFVAAIHVDAAILAALAAEADRSLSVLNAKQLANIAWASAKFE